MSEVVEIIRKVALKRCTSILQKMLAEADAKLDGPQTELLKSKENCAQILNIFQQNIGIHFDKILGRHEEEKQEMLYFELLALAQKRELEEMITVEGMVAAARNLCSPNFVPFNARLDSLIPRTQVDENNNPLDPDQITSAFEQSIQFLNLDALNRLSLFRDFNESVLKQLDDMFMEINEWLKKKGVLPELKAEYPASPTQVAEKKQLDDPELFSMVQKLLHSDSSSAENSAEELQAMIPTGSGIMQPVQFNLDKDAGKRKIEVIESNQLMEVLDNIGKAKTARHDGMKAGDDINQLFDPYDINESLGHLLTKTQSKDAILAVDRNSSDVINLVTMLYGAIWQDDSLPIPIKNLIGKTQLTVTKLALTDTSFFNKENHPAREIINELASAGTGWFEVEQLDQDPLYNKMQELVTRVTTEYKGDNTLFDVSLKEFRRYLSKEEKEKLKHLEDKILKSADRQECLDEIYELVSKNINERLASRKIHAFFRESLENFLHKYLVLIILKDGPDSTSWKQAINSLDVLIWTLEFNKDEEDQVRVNTANSKLLHSLKKVFKVSKLAEKDVETLIDSLTQAQKESLDSSLYQSAENKSLRSTSPEQNSQGEGGSPGIENVAKGKPAGGEIADAKDKKSPDPYLQQVDAFNIGTWVDLTDQNSKPVRCKLAAKIQAIDKYIFVNREGAKILESKRAELARMLKEGNIQLVSDGLLFSRALESVIGNLQDSQDQQRSNPGF